MPYTPPRGVDLPPDLIGDLVVTLLARRLASKYSSARLCLIKRALEQYDPVPFSGLTATSDFVANKKHAPKEPNPLTKDEQERLGVLYENSSKSSQRVVDAHRRGRTTLVA